MAGREIHKLSLVLILKIKAKNISKARPRDEMINSGLKYKPKIKPEAPKISSTMVNSPNFSTPRRLNASFMFGAVKYEVAYAKNDRLDIRMQILFMSI